MVKVCVILKNMQYEGTIIEKVFSDYAEAKEYVKRMYPAGKMDKEGDWYINEPGEKIWLSFHNEEVCDDELEVSN